MSVSSTSPEALELEAARAEIAALKAEAERRGHELSRAYQELSDSDRGLMRLHAELEEKGDSLRRESDVKTRLVANVSHEFRTPINSILGIANLLLERIDGDINDEQEKQLRFIRGSAQALSEFVNDLLDLSKLEAGKYHLRPSTFTVPDLMASLRGMMRPLLGTSDVELVFEDGADVPPLQTDEGKVAQILRNLVSNALKFTERGEVRVSARLAESDDVVFDVRDTGIGIGPGDQARIFEEFAQVDSARQRAVKGTGLGLSLSRKLADLLGGSLTVHSALGAGSTFSLRIPRVHGEVEAMNLIEQQSKHLDPHRAPVLVVEDDRQTLFLYEKYLSGSGFQVLPARSVEDARRVLERIKPAAVVLDVMLEGESTWRFLEELKEGEATRDIPVMVVTVVDKAQKARALGADEFWLKPLDGDRMLRRLSELARRHETVTVLSIDDDERARYILRRLLQGTPYTLLEAANGPAGVALARSARPSVIFLDFVLGELTAFDVLDELKADPRTRAIPVVIVTSKDLGEEDRARLLRETASILSKQQVSRELAITRIREALIARRDG